VLTIENDQLTVVINPKGAELTHVYHRQENFDYIWNGSEWAKHAPVLFPAIGRSMDDHYLIKGKEYPMPQHGFVSGYEFEVLSHESDRLVLSLKDNQETYKMYPFHFELQIEFALKECQLEQNFSVINLDNEALSFSIGSHPAFNVPIDETGEFSDYYLSFLTNQGEKVEQIDVFDIVKKPHPYRTGNLTPLAELTSGRLALNHALFDEGLLILKGEMKQIELASEKTNHKVRLNLGDFPYLTLWTKEGLNLPYLCLEPFYGLPDIYDQPQEISQKEGNAIVAPGETGVYQYQLYFD